MSAFPAISPWSETHPATEVARQSGTTHYDNRWPLSRSTLPYPRLRILVTGEKLGFGERRLTGSSHTGKTQDASAIGDHGENGYALRQSSREGMQDAACGQGDQND